MRFLTVLCVFFYTVSSFLIGGLLIALASELLLAQDITNAILFTQLNLNAKIITGLLGLMIIMIGVSFAQVILGRMEKEKTIAFHTPAGQVTIALSAVEDLIKRLSLSFPEIKELKPDVIANKKGVEIKLRVILYSEVNIPNLTSQLQELIKMKVQEM